MSELREKVARYLCNLDATDPDGIFNVGNPNESGPKVGWHFYTDEADAVLLIARPAIIEEAAAFVETFDDEVMSEDIARLMRKELAEKP